MFNVWTTHDHPHLKFVLSNVSYVEMYVHPSLLEVCYNAVIALHNSNVCLATLIRPMYM